MISDELEALAFAEAIGALDADERAELATLLAQLSDDERAILAERCAEATTALAAAVPTAAPPESLRRRVLDVTSTPGRYTLGAHEGEWFDTPFPGIRGRVLAVNRATAVATLQLRAEPGAVYPAHRHHGAEECYVVAGSVVIDGRTLNAGDFHHADAGSDHGVITTTTGAEVLIIGALEDYLPGY